MQFRGEQTRLPAQAAWARRKRTVRLPQRQLTKVPNSVRISEEKPKASGRGWRRRWSQRQLPSSFKKKNKKKERKKKISLPRGGESASRRSPRKCPGTAGEFRSCLVPWCVWESLVRALPPPLRLPRLADAEPQVGSSRLLPASQDKKKKKTQKKTKNASLPKVVAAAAGMPLVPDSGFSLALRRRSAPSRRNYTLAVSWGGGPRHGRRARAPASRCLRSGAAPRAPNLSPSPGPPSPQRGPAAVLSALPPLRLLNFLLLGLTRGA